MGKREFRKHLKADVDAVRFGTNGSIIYDKWLEDNYSLEMAPVVTEQLADGNYKVRAEIILFLSKVHEHSVVDTIRNLDIEDSYVVGIACIDYFSQVLDGDDRVYALLGMFDRCINNDLNYEIALNLGDLVGPQHRDFISSLYDRMPASKKVFLQKLLDKIDGKTDTVDFLDVEVDNSEYINKTGVGRMLVQKEFKGLLDKALYHIRLGIWN